MKEGLKRKRRRLPRFGHSPLRDSLKTVRRTVFANPWPLATYFPRRGKTDPQYSLPRILSRGRPFKKEKSRRLPTFPHDGVSSAQGCLTSVFGTGTGISTPPWPPAHKNQCQKARGKEGKLRRLGGNEDMARTHGLLVPLGCARRRACTCGLSTP